MSGSTASQALHQRFDAIRRAELARLQKKLAGLSDQERHSVDQITSHVIEALERIEPVTVETMEGKKEHIEFRLPAELRV